MPSANRVLANIKQQPIFAALTLALITCVLIRALLADNMEYYWAATQWTFNYQNGFIKRGLPGEILHWLSILPQPTTLQLIYFALAGMLTLALATLFTLPAIRQKNTGLQLFALFALSCPATIAHFLHDTFRMDVLGLLLALASMLLLHYRRDSIAALVVLLLMAIALLIHEAVFFMFIPMVMCFWLYQRTADENLLLPTLVFAALFALTFFISTYGLRDSNTLNDDFAAMQTQLGDWVRLSSYNVIYYSSVSENLHRTLTHGINLFRILQHLLLLLIVLIPLLILSKRFSRQQKSSSANSPRSLLLIASAFSPLALYPLGHDHFRWWALALNNGFIVIAILAFDNTTFRAQLAETFMYKRWLSVCFIALFIIAGPLGSSMAFNWNLIPECSGTCTKTINMPFFSITAEWTVQP